MSKLKELDDTNFSKTLQGANVPVLIDFSATWCQPCKALAPTIEAVSTEYQGKLDVYKVDIEKAPEAAGSFDIRGVPTCVFFRKGKEVDRFVGNKDLRSVRDYVNKVLGS